MLPRFYNNINHTLSEPEIIIFDNGGFYSVVHTMSYTTILVQLLILYQKIIKPLYLQFTVNSIDVSFFACS